MYAIERLKESYSMKTTKKKVDPTKSYGLQHSTIKVPNYRVEVYEEVENPLTVGKILQ